MECDGLTNSGWIDENGNPDYGFVLGEDVHAEWREWLGGELEKPYMKTLQDKIAKSHEELEELAIYPPRRLVFKAFAYGFPQCVILGQDPYIRENQACGLSFSVPRNQRRPQSLLNLYKEMARDPQISLAKEHIPKHGDLSSWAEQGVMLLNVALTVREGKSNSHMSLGWKTFTKAVIKRINDECPPGVVWLLWGNFAQSFAKNIDGTKHIVLKAGHPSPLNRSNPFIGSGTFSKANEALCAAGRAPIRWESIMD